MVHSECLEMTLSLSLSLTLSPLFIRCIQLAMTIEATLRGQTIPDLTPTTAIPLVTIETRQLLQQLLILTPTRTPEAMTWRLTVRPSLLYLLFSFLFFSFPLCCGVFSQDSDFTETKFASCQSLSLQISHFSSQRTLPLSRYVRSSPGWHGCCELRSDPLKLRPCSRLHRRANGGRCCRLHEGTRWCC